MAFNELDILTNEQLFEAIFELRLSLSSFAAAVEEVDEDGNLYTLSLSENYAALDLSERLELLIKEIGRRGLVVPDETT